MAVLDVWVWIPIITKFTVGLIVALLSSAGSKVKEGLTSSASVDEEEIEDEQSGGGIVLGFSTLLVQLVANAIPHYIRTSKLCNQNQVNYFGKGFVDGTIENGVALLLPTILKFVPIVNVPIRLLTRLPIIGKLVDKLLWVVFYIITHIIINKVNERDLGKLCNIGFLGTGTDRIAFVIFFIISLVFSFF